MREEKRKKMKVEQIKVEPFRFIELRELHISQSMNQHAAANVVMLIKDEWKEQYIGKLSEQTWVKIIGSDGAAGDKNTINTILFYGVVTDFCLRQDGYETILELKMMSGTILMDLKTHFRVFQNSSATYGSLCRKITDTYSQGKVECVESESNEIYGTLIQYEETDWEFLKRLTGRTGSYLVPDSAVKGVHYAVGLPKGARKEVRQGRIQMKLDADEYMKKRCNGMDSLQASDMLELEVTDREVFQLGDSLLYKGNDYFIYRMETEYEGKECVHRYFLRTKEALKVLPMQHRNITGCSFEAVVADVQRDKVQVEIARDEWGAFDGKKWFLYATVYSSPDGTGWYCMPEVGDSVRLYVPDKEENCFIISSVHKETDGSRQNPDYKSFKNRYGKEILFTPDTIVMTNNQGMMVEINDNQGVNIVSDKNIMIQAANNLTVASSSASLLVAADEKVQVKQGSTSMTLKEDISFTGGEFRIQ